MPTRVAMSSGDVFHVGAEPEDVLCLLDAPGFVRVGRRHINPSQVAQITRVSEFEISTIETPERLEEQRGDTN